MNWESRSGFSSICAYAGRLATKHYKKLPLYLICIESPLLNWKIAWNLNMAENKPWLQRNIGFLLSCWPLQPDKHTDSKGTQLFQLYGGTLWKWSTKLENDLMWDCPRHVKRKESLYYFFLKVRWKSAWWIGFQCQKGRLKANTGEQIIRNESPQNSALPVLWNTNYILKKISSKFKELKQSLLYEHQSCA